MIAKNYIKFPEALRFQCEMFSNGYHNSPRIMRLMEVVFSWTPTIPQWWKDARAAAKRLANAGKKAMYELFSKVEKTVKQIELDFATTTDQPFIETVKSQWKISLQINKYNKAELDRCGGLYRSVCRHHQAWSVSQFWHKGYSS